MAFENIMGQLDEKLEDKRKNPPKTYDITSLAPSIESVKETIANIDSLSDEDLLQFINMKYSTILETIFVKDDKSLIPVFTNIRFLSFFVNVVSSKSLSINDRIFCNKIAYDYLNSSQNSDGVIRDSLFNMSKHVNKEVIPSLIGLGLDENLSAYLALCRFSSSKEEINVNRVNYLIISSSIDIMTEQNIIFIYEKLFDNFTHLFKYTMMDYYTEEELNNISSCASDIYSNMNLAIVVILNAMPSDSIRKVLLSYANDYHVSKSQCRFTMDSLAVCDYGRILTVVDSLLRDEMVIVP